jgi:hypothetical protein
MPRPDVGETVASYARTGTPVRGRGTVKRIERVVTCTP